MTTAAIFRAGKGLGGKNVFSFGKAVLSAIYKHVKHCHKRLRADSGLNASLCMQCIYIYIYFF